MSVSDTGVLYALKSGLNKDASIGHQYNLRIEFI